MKLEQIFKVRVVENAKIKFNGDKVTFEPSTGSKSYETYMIFQHEGYYRDFNNNFYIYCKSVNEYVERDYFQNNRTIIDKVSSRSIADEFIIDGTVDIEYTVIRNLINLYQKGVLSEEKLKEELTKEVDIVKKKNRENFTKIYNKEL